MIAAESLGFGTVYIGALRNEPDAVAQLLGLPAGAVAVFGLCIGHERPGAAAEVKPRLAQEAIVHTDRYDSGSLHGAVERYDARSDVFRSRQGLAPSRWSDQLIDRWRDAASLKGRDRLSDTLRRLGFPLR